MSKKAIKDLRAALTQAIYALKGREHTGNFEAILEQTAHLDVAESPAAPAFWWSRQHGKLHIADEDLSASDGGAYKWQKGYTFPQYPKEHGFVPLSVDGTAVFLDGIGLVRLALGPADETFESATEAQAMAVAVDGLLFDMSLMCAVYFGVDIPDLGLEFDVHLRPHVQMHVSQCVRQLQKDAQPPTLPPNL